MTKADILQLGSLARIRLSDDEVVQFGTEIDSILAYVNDINQLVTPADTKKTVGAVYNVMRADEVTNEPESYTKALLEAMPQTDGRFLKVKNILGSSE